MNPANLVAGIDSSTQSCKVVVCDATSGTLLRSGSAPHPPGTSVPPAAWESSLAAAITAAGGLDDVSAIAVGAQQHGMVCLDDAGAVVRDALLWNDTRSAEAAEQLVAEFPGGPAAWADAVGSVPVASFTVTKLRWLAEHEPDNAAATAAVCLPHDWLSWRLRGAPGLDELSTDRGDASGTGYWSPHTGSYRPDLLELALGRRPMVPTVRQPHEPAGETGPGGSGQLGMLVPAGVVVGAGTGDNAAAALGLDVRPGDVVMSLGTSGVVSAVAAAPTADPTGIVAGFADATGHFLPLACTLNGAPTLGHIARLLGMTLDELSGAALATPPGAGGVVLVPYFDGERTPNRPHATASLHGLASAAATPGNVARAAFEGLLCGLADCLDALAELGVPVRRVLLVGGASRSPALLQMAPTVLAHPLWLPEPGEYVALGAARQAAWAYSGDEAPPQWPVRESGPLPGEIVPSIRERYAEAREMTLNRHIAEEPK